MKMAKKKIKVSDVTKKYLKVGGYVLIYGVVTFVSKKYLSVNGDLSILFGGLANFITFVVIKEIKKEGLYQALMK